MKYRGTFQVPFEITIPDEAIRRAVDDDEWQRWFYNLDEEGLVEMLTRCCGIEGRPLNRLDGFADMPEDVSGVKIKYELTEWERVE